MVAPTAFLLKAETLPACNPIALACLFALVEHRHAVTDSIEQRGPGARLILACRQSAQLWGLHNSQKSVCVIVFAPVPFTPSRVMVSAPSMVTRVSAPRS